MRLSDQELLKSILYDGRYDDVNLEIDEEVPARKSAAELREKRIAREKAKKRRSKIATRIAVPIMLAILLAGVLVTLDYLRSWGTVHPNVTVAHIDIGGKAPDVAKEYLRDRLGEYTEDFIQAVYVLENEVEDELDTPESEDEIFIWEIYPRDIGLTFDVATAVEHAYAFGRSDNLFESIRDRLLSYFEVHQVDIRAEADIEMSYVNLEPLRDAINILPVDSRVIFEEGSFVIESGDDGIKLDEEELVARMVDAALSRAFEIEVPTEIYLRDIDDENALRAAKVANEAMYLPVELRYGDNSWKIESTDIARLVKFIRSDDLEEEHDALLESADPLPDADVVLEVVISAEEVREGIVASILGADVGSSPVNARFVVSGSEVAIRPSEIGSGVDVEQLARDLATALVSAESDLRAVEVITTDIAPRRSTEDAEAMGVRELVATYTTNFTTGNAPRNHNIALIASMLDGILVAPGEEFSFNGATGQRTEADGFQAAGVIVGGQMTTAVGGGICQVSTTMFNTAMYAGVHITERINHSVFLPNYAPGRDAAVAANGPNFRFRNTLDSYILIATSSTNSSVTISFFGTDPGFDIEIRTGNFSRDDYTTREIRDDTMPRGERDVEVVGQRGGIVNVYYTVRYGDNIVHQQTFTSNYRTVEEVVRVGTMRESEDDD